MFNVLYVFSLWNFPNWLFESKLCLPDFLNCCQFKNCHLWAGVTAAGDVPCHCHYRLQCQCQVCLSLWYSQAHRHKTQGECRSMTSLARQLTSLSKHSHTSQRQLTIKSVQLTSLAFLVQLLIVEDLDIMRPYYRP